jgi:hypothetical protein
MTAQPRLTLRRPENEAAAALVQSVNLGISHSERRLVNRCLPLTCPLVRFPEGERSEAKGRGMPASRSRIPEQKVLQ